MNSGVPLRRLNVPVALAPCDLLASSPNPGAPTAVIWIGPLVVAGTTNVSMVLLWTNV